MNKIISILVILFSSLNTIAGNKILVYFNHPVDTAVSTTIHAKFLNSCMADTIVAYINRSKYTIDVAQYDYNQGSYANIADAINNAYSRGVVIRWIYNGSSSNTGLALLNSAIHTLGSPTTSSYNIMHDKFIIIDAYSSNPDDAVVWTGSFDWSTSEFNTDFNNTVFIQDSALAHAYTDEFNQMWGSTGSVPNTSLSKFGPFKTDLGRHTFTIGGNLVELFFSPSDGTNTHIQSSISSANTDLYFGIYTFTDASDANLIVTKYSSGVYVAGIDDSYSNSYYPYGAFTSGLGSNFIAYSGSGIYHNKFLIVDPSDKCSDPLVLTGSHNWTTSANTKNDENTIIIHNDTIANMYYQSFHANFTSLGGSLSIPSGCLSTVANISNQENAVIYPNPSSGSFSIKLNSLKSQKISIDLFNAIGQKITSLVQNETMQPGELIFNYKIENDGNYFVHINIGSEHFVKNIVVINRSKY